MAWELYLTDEVDGWLNDLAATDQDSYAQVVAGDMAGNWSKWYRSAIPLAERLYEQYLQQRTTEKGDG